MKNFTQYANSFQAVSKLRLEGVESLLEKLGAPHKNLKIIHVAGTNGKGSVCAFLQSILTEAGMKTGKFISPNMIDVCERISIDGNNIAPEDMERLMQKIEAAAKTVEQERGEMPTQFEIWTAAAFLYFKENCCDIVVLETGLGGTLDATNVVEAPLFSLITKIDMDHMDYLGDTIELVASAKAGIIKAGCPVISVPQKIEAEKVLKAVAKEKVSPIFTTDAPVIIGRNGCREVFCYGGIEEILCGLCGKHQTENASLAVECAIRMGIGEDCIKRGIKSAKNIGRFEVVKENPVFIFDGAHNGCGMETLVNALKEYFPEKKVSFIYAAMADKDLSPVFEILKKGGFADSSFYTVMVKNNPRAQTAQKLAQYFCENGFDACSCESFGEAYEKACVKDAVTVACGSLYLYKDMTEYFVFCNKKIDVL